MANDKLKKLDEYINKLNKEQQVINLSKDKSQIKIDEGIDEIDTIKEHIKETSMKITSACLDGKMTE